MITTRNFHKAAWTGITLLGAPLLALNLAAPAAAQLPTGATGREVVQPLPSEEVRRLNDALLALARQPRDVPTLVEAGNAALQLDDLEAAMGFFGRAGEIQPDNARVKMGMAAVYIRSGRPIDALRLFREAEAAGASAREVMLDRALAYDLVGNNIEAQATYRAAIAVDPSDEAIRRLALSHAIAGEPEAFEQVLRPLLEQRDFAAYRARAFGLAILGDTTAAAAIADAVMPRDLAARMIPYLEFMPRLTKAQQAAAANLGIFPRAAEIGREDPRVAEFARQGSAIANAADARLAPAGAPLGAPSPTADSGAVESTKAESTDSDSNDQPGARAAEEAVEREQLAVAAPLEQEPPAAEATTPAPRPGFDLARMSTGSASEPATAVDAEPSGVSSASAETPASANAAAERPEAAGALTELASVDDAFANFDLAAKNEPDQISGTGAVDISAIEVPREIVPAPEPKPPAHPSRIWVQVATGRDRNALKFDWRRIRRSSSDLLSGYNSHVVRWGQTNRLLAGPLDSRREARRLVNGLKQQGVDSFPFISAEGQEIQRLD